MPEKRLDMVVKTSFYSKLTKPSAKHRDISLAMLIGLLRLLEEQKTSTWKNRRWDLKHSATMGRRCGVMVELAW